MRTRSSCWTRAASWSAATTRRSSIKTACTRECTGASCFSRSWRWTSRNPTAGRPRWALPPMEEPSDGAGPTPGRPVVAACDEGTGGQRLMVWHGGSHSGDDENLDEDEILGKSYDGKLMRRFLPYLKPYSKGLGMALLFLLVTSALDLAGPYLIGYAIDHDITPVRGHSHPGGLPLILAIFLAALSISFLLKYVMGYVLQFFDKNPVGRLITRLTGDVDALNDLLTQGVVSILGDGVMLLFIVAAMLIVNWKLSLIGLAVLPVITII